MPTVPDTAAGRLADRVPGARLLRWPGLLAPGLALTVFAIKLSLLARYGNATPFWDEWPTLSIMLDYDTGRLSLGALLEPSNEHRMVTSRLVTLLLFELNGLWDPLLQMIVNAAIHAGFGVFLLRVLGRELTPLARALLALAIVAFIATPNASENLLMSYQTNFYLTLLFGCVALNLVARHPDFSLACIAGLAALALSFLSLSSGVFAILSCLGVVVLKWLLGVDRGPRPVLVALLLVLASAGALWATPTVAAHAPMKAASVADFVSALIALAGWPLGRTSLLAALIVNAPMLILLVRTIRNPPPSPDTTWVVLGLGAWSAAQFVALAELRATGILANRYLDFCALNAIANFVCLAKMFDLGARRAVIAAWLCAIGIGLIVQTVPLVRNELGLRRQMAATHERNIRAYLATGAFPADAGPAPMTLPFPDTALLARYLSDANVRRFLPSNLQPALATERARLALPEPRDRLGSMRDGLLTSSRYLIAAGLLLLVVGMLSTLLQRRPRETA